MAEARTQGGVTAELAGFDTVVHCLRVTVTVREGPTSFQLSAVVRPGSAALPATETRASATPARDRAAAATTAAATTTAPSLGYPFTLLDLEERIELAPPPVS